MFGEREILSKRPRETIAIAASSTVVVYSMHKEVSSEADNDFGRINRFRVYISIEILRFREKSEIS
jgi:hypothetical protein